MTDKSDDTEESAQNVKHSLRHRKKAKKKREVSPPSPQLCTGVEKSESDISPRDLSYNSERSPMESNRKSRRKHRSSSRSHSMRAANASRDIGVGMTNDQAQPCRYYSSRTEMPELMAQNSEYLYDKYDQASSTTMLPSLQSIVFEVESLPSKKLYYCKWTVYWLLWTMTVLFFFLLINRDYYCPFLDANAS